MEHVTVQKTSRFSKLKVGIAAVALGALLVVPSAGADTDDCRNHAWHHGFNFGSC